MSFIKYSNTSLASLLLMGCCVLFISPLQGQEATSGFGVAPQTESKTACLTDDHRQAIWAQLQASIQSMDFLVSESTEEDEILFESPIRQGVNYDDQGFSGISNYFDHNAAFPEQVRDFQCGTRTYDTQNGYNHQGIDYFSWPFGWLKMDNDHVEVVAAAAGTIIWMEGNQYDKSCDFNNNQWNAVYVRHSDGSVAWYGHLKQSSLTTKRIGDQVEVGEFLGIMGSSGNSTGPHLHFEVYDSEGNLIDPYIGSCNPTTSRSWWAEQEPYRVPMINKLMTNSAAATFGCYGQEKTNQEVNFTHGQLVYFTLFFRDQMQGTSSTNQMLRPDGSIYQQWTITSNQDYNGSWWWNSYALPSSGSEGKWTFRATYNGVVTEEYFYLTPAEASVDLAFSSNEIVFEDVAAGESKTESFTITNNGSAGLIVTGINYPNMFEGNWDGLIHTGESKEIKVTFSPLTDVNFTGNLVLKTNVGDIPFPINAATGCSEINVSVSRSVCEGDSFIFGDQTLTEPGNYTALLQTAAGCDSTVNLTLNHVGPVTETASLTVCTGAVYVFGEQQILQPGNYTETFISSIGCDSTVNLSLDFTDIDLTVTENEGTLTVSEPNASYQWYDCATNTLVPDANEQTFTPGTAGQYRVKVVRADCELTSACVMVDLVLGIESNEISSDLRVFPNPGSDQVTVDFGQVSVNGDYELISISGNRMASGKLVNRTSFLLQLRQVPQGMYFLRITDRQGRRSIINLIKQ